MKEPKSAYVISYNEVTNNNFSEYFPIVMSKVNHASHIAIDLEFTCLGSKKKIRDMAHKYVDMKRAVESAAIASIGISIFKKKKDVEDICSQVYECDNFNLLPLKQGNITIETSIGTFLCNHGYSFDALFTQGIPFTPPSEATNNKSDTKLINFWKHIIDIMRYKKIPLILHNGLYDLMYIYHSFIEKLPEHFNGFVSKISELFPNGLYDTRYLADKLDFQATFLEYVFSKSDRLRQNRFQQGTKEKPYFEVHVNPSILKNQVSYGIKRKRDEEVEKEDKLMKKSKYCQHYAERGYCTLGHSNTSKYHDVQIILDDQMGPSKYQQVYTSKIENDDSTHAAHFDAYMTAFGFCYFLHTMTPNELETNLNKMNLSGFNFPLTFPIKSENPEPKI